MTMKRLFWACAALAGAQFVAPCFAADGTWASASQGGFWGDMYQWSDQVIAGDGGAATFNFSQQTGRIAVLGNGETYALSGLAWGSSEPANTDTAPMELNGLVLHLNAPARITRSGGTLSIGPNVIETDGDLTLSGPGRTIFNGTHPIGGKLRVENGGWVRAQIDSSLGPTPATLVPDAVTLDDGILQNGGDTTLAATRGITLGPNGGTLAAGYLRPAKLTVNGPVTGPGELHIAVENSPVKLCNPANDWAGDTVVGSDECGLKAWSDWCSLLLGADEVIPHGEGRGVLRLGRGDVNINGARPPLTLDLDGHVETVNAVDATCQGVVRSTTPGGVLKTCGAQDMDFRGTIRAGVTVELRGTGRMDLSHDTADVSGTLALHSGSLDFAAGVVRAGGTLVYAGGEARVVARHSATDPSATFPSTLPGMLRLDADLTLRVAAGAGPLTVAGAVVTDPANPHTLTIVTEDGSPVSIGSPDAASAARLVAPLVCASGVVLRDNVWLTGAPPADAVVAPGTSFTYGYDGALAADRVLDADVRIACDNPGTGALTVPTGRTATFSTQTTGADGALVDGADRTRTFSNAVVLQGGTLAFDGAGTTVFNGAVSGYGKILVSGTGSVILPNGQALAAGCTVEIANGRFVVPSADAIGAASVLLRGGRLATAEGASLELANPVHANGGGFEASGADATLTLTCAVTQDAPVSKWGDGTLRLAGEAPNDVYVHVRGGTLALAKAQAVRSVIGCEPGTTVRLEADGAVGRTSEVRVTLGGGTLDLNGHDLVVPTFQMLAAGGLVTNNGSADATLNATAAFTCSGAGAIADGAARVLLRKGGTDVTDFTGVGIANSGLVAAAGTVRFAGEAVAQATQLRFTATKARPNGAYAGTGIQFSELRLLHKGEPVAWPEGTTATSANPAAGSREDAAKIVDGDVETKWYSSSGVNMPVTITCGAPVTFDGYQFATANDAEGRDPVSWRLEMGVEQDGAVVWTTLDTRTEVADDIPMTRKTFGPAYLVDSSLPAHTLPDGYALTVEGPATASFAGADDVLVNLSGSGTLAATGTRSPTIAAPSTFTGSVAGEAPVKLALDTAEIPGFVGTAAGTKLVNDGVAGALTFTDAGTAVTQAGLDDGAAPLGLALAGDTTLVLAGAGGAHTGPTTVGAGSTLISSSGIFAKWIRFTPIKGSGGQTKTDMQFSELQLLCFGQRLPWPEGTTAASEGTSSFKDEGCMQLLDGDVETKCYWSSAVDAVTIEMPYAAYFDGYRWYSGNDSMTTRNPVSWTFEYSMDGVNWTLLDEQTDRETTTQVKTLAYTFSATAEGAVAVADAASDVSPVAVADGGTLAVAGVDETFGGLSGAGALKIEGGAVARFNPTADAAFTGAVSGAGTLAKTGAARQTFSGAVNLDGSIVVEAGVLDLSGATLTGVTNIVLKGGVLMGAATVAGDLAVVSAGGAYNASLAVAGRLKLEGPLALATGYAGQAVRNVAFTFGSTDDATRAIFQAATAVEELPRAWKLTVTNGDKRMSWSVAPGGLTIFIR